MHVPGELMSAEIDEQPAVLAGLIAEGAEAVGEVRGRLRVHPPRFVVFAARGTSDHAALYGKYLVEIHSQLPAGLASPSTLTLYDARPDLREVLFIAVSQSGGSPDLVRSVEVARECGALTVAVTNDATSAVAGAAEHHVDVRAGQERAVAATKSYTAQLLALHLLLVGGDTSALPEAAARTLAAEEPLAAAARYRFAQRLVTTARGYSYATAREAALKVMETSYLAAQAFSGADLLHGPMAMVDVETPVIAVSGPGAGGEAMTPVIERVRRSGADVLVVGSEHGLPVVADGVPEELRPVLEILPLQRLAWRMALDRGVDPDQPRGLAKVTQTW